MHATVPSLIHGILGGTVVLVVLALAVAYLPLVVAGLISVLTSGQNVGMKVMWIVLILAAPLIGSIVWFLAGRTYHCPPRTS
ncbi:MAG: Phospholipase D-nuclease N-terminal [Actinoplanes sp.]|nr:Phospholipase D-nuclease N-terminal [Actinoplanes sp.]